MMITNSLVKIKDSPPYSPELESKVLLNSLARASLSPRTGQYSFTKLATEKKTDLAQVQAVSKFLSETGSVAGVGVDQGAFFVSTSDLQLMESFRAYFCRPIEQPYIRDQELH